MKKIKSASLVIAALLSLTLNARAEEVAVSSVQEATVKAEAPSEFVYKKSLGWFQKPISEADGRRIFIPETNPAELGVKAKEVLAKLGFEIVDTPSAEARTVRIDRSFFEFRKGSSATNSHYYDKLRALGEPTAHKELAGVPIRSAAGIDAGAF